MATHQDPVRKKRMPVVREKARSWKRRAAIGAAGFLVVMMGYGVVFGHNGITAFAAKRQETNSLQQQMQQLQTENERLRGHVDRLQNDPGAIEHQAREELHYTRAGEVIVSIAEPASQAAAPSTQR